LNELNPEGTQPRMDSTPKGLNPKWDSTLNGLNPEWDSTPNGTKPRLGLNPDRDSTSNSSQLRMAQSRLNIKISLFSLNVNQVVYKKMDLKETIIYSLHENQITVKNVFFLELKLWAIRG
jgi:hypothetical protein